MRLLLTDNAYNKDNTCTAVVLVTHQSKTK